MWSKILVLISVLFLLDLFGAYDPAESLTLKGYFKAYDLAVVLACLPAVWHWWKSRRRSHSPFHATSVYMVAGFFGLVCLSSIATFLAGGVTVESIVQMARNYLPYALILPVIHSAIYMGNTRFYYRVIMSVAAVATAMIILVAIFGVDWFTGWPKINVVYQGEYIENVQRLYFTAFTFPILAFIAKFWEFAYARKAGTSILLAVYAIGFLLQGFRSYIVATGAGFLFFFILSRIGHRGSLKSILRWSIRSLLAGGVVTLCLWMANPQIVEGIRDRVESAATDFFTQSGSFGFRLLDNAFRWDLFWEHPIFGVGLVHVDTARGAALGLEWEGTYALGTTDSGYLDILTKFGLVGLTFFVVFAVVLMTRCVKISRQSSGSLRAAALTGATFVFVLAVTQISHSGFTALYGIVPLVLILGVIEADYFLQSERKPDLPLPRREEEVAAKS